MAYKPRVIVVGGGLAGLMAVIKIAEAGVPCDLFSIVPCRRSHSVCAQGGINGAVNTKGEGDSPERHFDDTVYGGDFLANQTMAKAMCEAAPGVIYLFDRMGVPFSRTPEGLLDFRRFGGTLHNRTAFAGATTGQQLLYALDEQVRRWEVEGRVTRYEGWEFLSTVLDDSKVCHGIVALDIATMEMRSFPGEAVILATGGIGRIFGRSTNSLVCTGSAPGAVFKQGVDYCNPEMVQVHPTAVPGEDKNRLMSESLRGEGGRVWTYKEGKPWYFLEEKYPKYGNLVPRDVATREIFKVVTELGLGVEGKALVYLDLTHLSQATHDKIRGVTEIYERFLGEDARKVPLKVFPSMHYTMGGMWIENKVGTAEDHMTNIKGLYAAGEAEYQYHGANRLGANALMSCTFAGMLAGPASVRYMKSLGGKDASTVPSSVFDAQRKREEERFAELKKRTGPENTFKLCDELGDMMTKNCTVVRYKKKLLESVDKVKELKERAKKAALTDDGGVYNEPLRFAAQFDNMLEIAHCITLGASLRDESRGAHYMPEFPNRDDEKFLKTTRCAYAPDGPKVTYDPVDIQYIKPRPRKYD